MYQRKGLGAGQRKATSHSGGHYLWHVPPVRRVPSATSPTGKLHRQENSQTDVLNQSATRSRLTFDARVIQ